MSELPWVEGAVVESGPEMGSSGEAAAAVAAVAFLQGHRWVAARVGGCSTCALCS